ncbi:MAG TPA: transposase [Opitutaceae bacterium]
MIENKGHMGLRARYSDEFIARALDMLRSSGSVTEVSRELGVARSVLYRWRDDARGPSRSPGEVAGDEGGGDSAELRRLRKEVERLQVENDILKKAAVILGSDRPSKRGG